MEIGLLCVHRSTNSWSVEQHPASPLRSKVQGILLCSRKAREVSGIAVSRGEELVSQRGFC